MLFNKFEALIFDMDGVITLTEPYHAEAERDICLECGFNVPLSEWEKFRGKTADDIFTYLIATYGHGQPLDMHDLIRRKTARYEAICRQRGIPSVPGVVDFIRWARESFPKIALATSSNSVIQRLTFDALGLHPYFDAVVTGDDLTRGKPDPQAYLLAAERLGAKPERCLVIEDSDNGVRAGKAAGCLVAGITTEFSRQVLTDCGADFVVDDYTELRRRLNPPIRGLFVP